MAETMARNSTTYADTMTRKLNLTSMIFLPSTVVAAAINAETNVSPNPSTVVTTNDPETVTTTVKAHHHVSNVTEYLVEHDELDQSILPSFSDIQTVLLACISTLLPLIIALGIAFGCRHVWRKYRNGENGFFWKKSSCASDNTTESQHHHPHSGNVTVEAATRVLSAQDLVNGLDVPRYMSETEVMVDVNVSPTADVMEYTTTTSSSNHTSKNANGNIITLTLKNNHLIVETEERAVTMEDSKPASRYKDSGCSYVVDVQPDYDKEESEGNKESSEDMTAGVTDQQALVHREEIPDDRPSSFDCSRYRLYGLFGSTNTGLSQSDLSISSQGSANPSYRYGNQVEYDVGHLGYPMYGGSYESDVLSRKLEGRSKWIEFDKSPDIEKTLLDDSRNLTSEDDDEKSPQFYGKSKNMSSLQDVSATMRKDSLEINSFPDAVRSNPNLQVNGSTPNKLEIMEQKALSNDFASSKSTEINKPVITGVLLKNDVQEDAFQEQQRKLGNGTLTPEHNKENDTTTDRKPEGSVFVPSHKRAGSIPPRLIEETLEMDRKKPLDIYNKYSQIKTSTRSMLPSLSPKFELLQNEVSPIEEKES